MFHLEQRKALPVLFSVRLNTNYIPTIYEEVKKKLIKSQDSENVQIEKCDGNVE